MHMTSCSRITQEVERNNFIYSPNFEFIKIISICRFGYNDVNIVRGVSGYTWFKNLIKLLFTESHETNYVTLLPVYINRIKTLFLL